MLTPDGSHLFDEGARQDEGLALHEESNFAFLNRVHSPWWGAVRRELERWFATYPPDQRADLRGRFRSSDERQHSSAWWSFICSACSCVSAMS